ncbi:MAG: response regulator transcription factor [Proteobacteria bacterium]|nr:response regulator transcription factor [Pseudomonadota bacterium]
MRILIVEDQGRIGAFLEKALREHSYTTTWVRSCAEARDALSEASYGAIVLDLGLPDGDGLELLRQWRKAGFNEPVLILSARDTVQDRINGLDLGADDYLPKPFSLEELLARLRSLLRRQSAVKEAVIEHRGIRLDLTGHSVHQDGRAVDLTNREFALLELFMQNPGRILTRELICEKCWSSDHANEASLLDVYMSRLRAKLDTTPGAPLFKTLRGVGYQML